MQSESSEKIAEVADLVFWQGLVAIVAACCRTETRMLLCVNMLLARCVHFYQPIKLTHSQEFSFNSTNLQFIRIGRRVDLRQHRPRIKPHKSMEFTYRVFDGTEVRDHLVGTRSVTAHTSGRNEKSPCVIARCCAASLSPGLSPYAAAPSETTFDYAVVDFGWGSIEDQDNPAGFRVAVGQQRRTRGGSRCREVVLRGGKTWNVMPVCRGISPA